ncbi:MAG: histidine kinase [Ferruginibacter sp.]
MLPKTFTFISIPWPDSITQKNNMSWKYVPFAGFFLFTVLVTAVRIAIIPEFTWPVHLAWFVGQYCLLLGIWFTIRVIARLLDKKLPYVKSFSRRVFFQVTLSIAIIVPPIIIAYNFLLPYLPKFFSSQFVALSFITLLVLVVLMNVGFAAGHFFKNWQNSIKENAKIELEKSNAEMELLVIKQKQAEIEMRALRAQMNPHFIFNSLNSINKYILKSDHANASRYLTRFAKLIRLILDNSNSKEVALSNELEALKLYIEMEALRFSNRFIYEIIIDENVCADNLQVPPLIIQPYVENAIWHGLLHKESGGKLTVDIKTINDNMLQCTIEDNGIGRAKASELKSKSAPSNKSLGMKLTEERINILNQYASMNASIKIIDLTNNAGEASGTKVILAIPI